MARIFSDSGIFFTGTRTVCSQWLPESACSLPKSVSSPPIEKRVRSGAWSRVRLPRRRGPGAATELPGHRFFFVVVAVSETFLRGLFLFLFPSCWRFLSLGTRAGRGATCSRVKLLLLSDNLKFVTHILWKWGLLQTSCRLFRFWTYRRSADFEMSFLAISWLFFMFSFHPQSLSLFSQRLYIVFWNVALRIPESIALGFRIDNVGRRLDKFSTNDQINHQGPEKKSLFSDLRSRQCGAMTNLAWLDGRVALLEIPVFFTIQILRSLLKEASMNASPRRFSSSLVFWRISPCLPEEGAWDLNMFRRIAHIRQECKEWVLVGLSSSCAIPQNI